MRRCREQLDGRRRLRGAADLQHRQQLPVVPLSDHRVTVEKGAVWRRRRPLQEKYLHNLYPNLILVEEMHMTE